MLGFITIVSSCAVLVAAAREETTQRNIGLPGLYVQETFNLPEETNENKLVYRSEHPVRRKRRSSPIRAQLAVIMATMLAITLATTVSKAVRLKEARGDEETKGQQPEESGEDLDSVSHYGSRGRHPKAIHLWSGSMRCSNFAERFHFRNI